MEELTDKQKAFLGEFQALLEKYDATISVECYDETEEHYEAYIRVDNHNIIYHNRRWFDKYTVMGYAKPPYY